jgi:hypothetical protein
MISSFNVFRMQELALDKDCSSVSTSSSEKNSIILHYLHDDDEMSYSKVAIQFPSQAYIVNLCPVPHP